MPSDLCPVIAYAWLTGRRPSDSFCRRYDPGRGDLASGVELDGQGVGLKVEPADPPFGAVGDAEPVEAVRATHDAVPDAELPVLVGQRWSGQAASSRHSGMGEAIEPVDLDAAVGEHDRVLTSGERLPPVQGHRLVRLDRRLSHGDPPAVAVQGERFLAAALADQLDSLLVEVVALPPVGGQLRAALAQPEAAEPAACVDRLELAVVTDQDELGADPIGVSLQLRELARAKHVALITDHGVGAGEGVASVVQV